MAIHKINEDKERAIETKRVVVLLVKYFKIFPPILMIAIIVIGYIFLIEPKYKKMNRNIRIARSEKELEYNAYQGYLNQLNKLMRSYKKIAPEDIKKLNYMLSDRADPEELFIQLESIVYKNGLILDSMKLEWEGSGGGFSKGKAVSKGDDSETTDGLLPEFGKINISIKASGVNYTGLKKLLSDIENNLRLIDVHNIGFTPKESVSLEMYTYYQKGL